eukprot:1772647-Pyramimonas_sp.AAC.1
MALQFVGRAGFPARFRATFHPLYSMRGSTCHSMLMGQHSVESLGFRLLLLRRPRIPLSAKSQRSAQGSR